MFDIRLDDLSRLESEIEEFEREQVETGKILFYGSSMFTRWSSKWGHRELSDDIPGAVNHGFGSSTAEELLYFYPRAVRPWKPRVLVLRVCSNDIGFGYSPAEIFFLLQRVIAYARKDMPGIKFLLCSSRVTPSAGGSQSTPRFMAQYNELLNDYCSKHDDCVCLSEVMIPELYDSPEHVGQREHLRKELYVEDMMHFNQDGYDIYKKHILNALKDYL